MCQKLERMRFLTVLMEFFSDASIFFCSLRKTANFTIWDHYMRKLVRPSKGNKSNAHIFKSGVVLFPLISHSRSRPIAEVISPDRHTDGRTDARTDGARSGLRYSVILKWLNIKSLPRYSKHYLYSCDVVLYNFINIQFL